MEILPVFLALVQELTKTAVLEFGILQLAVQVQDIIVQISIKEHILQEHAMQALGLVILQQPLMLGQDRFARMVIVLLLMEIATAD